MPKYRVHMSATATQTVTVEADNEEQAIERAHDEGTTSVCAQCSGWGKQWSLDLDEFEVDEDVTLPDGTVFKAVELDD
jgi:hypothetical protein